MAAGGVAHASNPGGRYLPIGPDQTVPAITSGALFIPIPHHPVNSRRSPADAGLPNP
jgi:hypothetical protein